MLLTTGQHQATLKFWMNGKPSKRMYVLDNCTQLVQDLNLRAGCKLQFFKRPDDRVVGCHLPGALSELIAALQSCSQAHFPALPVGTSLVGQRHAEGHGSLQGVTAIMPQDE